MDAELMSDALTDLQDAYRENGGALFPQEYAPIPNPHAAPVHYRPGNAVIEDPLYCFAVMMQMSANLAAFNPLAAYRPTAAQARAIRADRHRGGY
jgi:hypothetical protein